MEAKQRITNIVKDRVVGIMSHGKSIEELEKRIYEFKNYNICWTSFNLYSIMDDFILNQIGKKLEIILECAHSKFTDYEKIHRIPNIIKYIGRGALVLTTWKLMGTEFQEKGIHDFYLRNKARLILVDEMLGKLNVSNTLALLIYSVMIGEPKRIILFGVDGYKGDANDDEFTTYYKPKLQRQRRFALLGRHYSLATSSSNFEKMFWDSCKAYCKQLNIKMPEIINCSPQSLFKLFKNVNYDEIKEYCK